MLIEAKILQHWIDHFYGYGSWDAPVWFVSHEEGGGDLPEDVADRINYFFREHDSTTPTLCDIRELYRHVAFRWESPRKELYGTLYDYRFAEDAPLNTVWKNLISFLHGYRNKALPDLLAYQRSDFASPQKSQEALIKLFPLPAPNNHGWYYSWLDLPEMQFLKSRAQYEAHLYTDRIRAILINVSVYKPELVLMYGMNNINTLKQSVQEFFPSATFKLAKAIRQQIPQHHITEVNRTKLVITTQIPALRHNRVETGFEWEVFGKTIAGRAEKK